VNTAPVPPPTIALVDKSRGAVSAPEIERLAAALTIQVRDHLQGNWLIAPVTIATGAKPPGAVWPITLYERIPKGTAAGYHLSGHLIPYANIDLSKVGDDWTIVVSHELLEMLVDPWGYRMWWARAPHDFADKREFPFVPYLVEICDPCPLGTYAIDIGDGGTPIAVSDFVFPSYFDHREGEVRAEVGPTSMTDVVGALDVVDGGYLSFRHPQTGDFWWKQNFEGKGTVVEPLPKSLGVGTSLREEIDEIAREVGGAKALAET
jgi:hypothetical protein